MYINCIFAKYSYHFTEIGGIDNTMPRMWIKVDGNFRLFIIWRLNYIIAAITLSGIQFAEIILNNL